MDQFQLNFAACAVAAAAAAAAAAAVAAGGAAAGVTGARDFGRPLPLKASALVRRPKGILVGLWR